jgi:formylglycine-generating enzyme required for sulfatase activity
VDVGSFPSGNSFYGVSDLAGNVWEMTSGHYPDPANGPYRTMRGGSFYNNIAEVRVTVRWAPEDAEREWEYLGFRCVVDARDWQKNARAK